MYRNLKSVIVILGLSAILAGCAVSTTYNRNSMAEKIVTAHKLKNGKILKVGYKKPQPAWGCKLIKIASYNWALEKFEGMTKLGGGYQKLRDQAIAYANQNHNVNYAFLYIPNTTSVMGFNVTAARRTQIYYFNCKNPPAVRHNPF